ncbi:MAG TPA: FadR/GntR family transcriptional regulator [Thermodesulfobacteriota bacterium]|nr:FadR/GntR family transcriptional regulator [Thermodesulfobacteriota bacterium]
MGPFQSVKTAKISERIARQIKETILSGSMKSGDRLPSERELVEHFQASRISIREALKSLETSGLLAIKPGSGVFVAEINSKPMSESLSSILRIQKTSINALTEARVILEPSIARLAAERITVKELTAIEENIEETLSVLASHSPAPEQNIRFHSLIAEATHNPVITSTMNPIFDVLKEMNLELRGNLPKRIELSRDAVEHHRKILKAFQQKNSQKIYELMLKHILQNQGGLKKVTSVTQTLTLPPPEKRGNERKLRISLDRV